MIRVTTETFDPGAETEAVGEGREDVGAVATFTGRVRSTPEQPVEALEIEHYPGMTERALSNIAEEAARRWDLIDLRVIHRHGRLKAGEVIVFVGAAASHRRAAFEAAEFVMDQLKTNAPFWKKEVGPRGAQWVEAKAEDFEAAARWTRKPAAE